MNPKRAQKRPKETVSCARGQGEAGAAPRVLLSAALAPDASPVSGGLGAATTARTWKRWARGALEQGVAETIRPWGFAKCQAWKFPRGSLGSMDTRWGSEPKGSQAAPVGGLGWGPAAGPGDGAKGFSEEQLWAPLITSRPNATGRHPGHRPLPGHVPYRPGDAGHRDEGLPVCE